MSRNITRQPEVTVRQPGCNSNWSSPRDKSIPGAPPRNAIFNSWPPSDPPGHGTPESRQPPDAAPSTTDSAPFVEDSFSFLTRFHVFTRANQPLDRPGAAAGRTGNFSTAERGPNKPDRTGSHTSGLPVDEI
ncbi:hypothetical protein EYF80_047680 [Liparis tanakae]|uniref:Uncharacterized protein n=1 Tax=Liparis tanakae TaxID=230148 RepID=A0A4Z2FLM0_9TELE|nr:hypothetical protein EYF80_047680 [Liparis tanakae]